MNRHDFLLEIRTEEIPAPSLAGARQDLQTRVTEGLAEEGLVAEFAQSFATPRRLILVLRGLPERQEDRVSEVLGPPASVAFDAGGKPTRAGEGFARAQKVDPADLVVVETPRGPTAAARRTILGRPAGEVLAADRSAGRRDAHVSQDDALGLGRARLRPAGARAARSSRR